MLLQLEEERQQENFNSKGRRDASSMREKRIQVR
jgi:hypothetical protein